MHVTESKISKSGHGGFWEEKKHLFFFFFYKSGLIFSFWVMEVSFLRVRKGHIQFLMWPFPHCQKWHFQCPKQKNKTTSIDHGYPQVVEKNTLIHEIFLKIPQRLNFKIWDSKSTLRHRKSFQSSTVKLFFLNMGSQHMCMRGYAVTGPPKCWNSIF